MIDGRRARSARTRAALIDAALELIVREGAGSVTQRKVAAAAGTSLASTTYHFRTAEDLVIAAFEESARRTSDQLETMAENVVSGRSDLIDAAMAFAARAPYGVDFPSDAIPQLVAAAAHNPRLRAVSESYFAGMAQLFAPWTTPPDAGSTVAHALTGLLLHELERGEHRPTAAFRTDVTRLFDAFGITERVADAARRSRAAAE
ncbi:TetR family transcriptional regulator [Flexivirga sp. ID2601S]|uniref:TetR family transcriptional regulator n=1 Tax=Flexivirga aerilata TaxID=1656889 RepID=A0A849AFQ8_9MICO|nr:TetR family transcriptional regulator [Flexivirga aerilata]NNG38416.1 TetR family transcriptional regulator [Flexivirga aerilata]